MTTKSKKVSFRADPETVRNLDKLASDRRMCRSEFLQIAIEGFGNENEKGNSEFDKRLTNIEASLAALSKQIALSQNNSMYFSTFAVALANGVVNGISDPKRLLESAKNAAQARIQKKPEITK